MISGLTVVFSSYLTTVISLSDFIGNLVLQKI